ncbi:MAG: HAD family phosphatase [Paludibacter sp.]|nr:HAD family phosphatase [Paludibacter sp.]
MKIKGVVFDLNGTLIWDTPYHNLAFDIFLEKHDIQLTDEEKRIKIHGKTNPDIMRGIFEHALSEDEIRNFSIEKESIYQGLIINDLHFAEGVEELFDSLNQSGIPFTIATSSDLFNVDFYFREMKLDRWFTREKVIYNDGTLNGKPEPDIFLRAAARLELLPAEIVIFEDSKAGIVAAESAGAGKIVIVNSNKEDYAEFSHDSISHFNEVDKVIFS